jgi:hypothetical protein
VILETIPYDLHVVRSDASNNTEVDTFEVSKLFRLAKKEE